MTLPLRLLLVVVFALLSADVRAMNVENVLVTTECTNCDDGVFTIYNNTVYLVVRGQNGSGEPTIDAINLENSSVTNLMTGTLGATWFVSDAAGQFVTYGQQIVDVFTTYEAYRSDLDDVLNPVFLPNAGTGQSFTAARVDASGRVIGVLRPAHPAATSAGAVTYEDGTGTVIVVTWPSAFWDVLDSPDVILATSWWASPPLPYEDRFYALESGVSTGLQMEVVTGTKRMGSNVIDPVTILATVDGVTGYIPGLFGTFQPLETGATAVAVTDNFLFWNGASDCTGYSTTLGIFDLGDIAGAGALAASSCTAAIEHDGKLYLNLDDSGVVATFDAVVAAPGLGPVGMSALVLFLAWAGTRYVVRRTTYSSSTP